MFKIYINNKQDKNQINEADLKNIIHNIFDCGELEKRGELSVTLVDDEEITQLNRKYRNLDQPTDVLAFAQDEGMEFPSPGDEDYTPLMGDVIISVPTASRQAEQMNHSLRRELTVLLIHGILHIFGYDHDNLYQQTFMREEEKAILQAIENKEKVAQGV